MPVSVESQRVLDELVKSGVDPAIIASLQTDLDSKPDADKTLSNGVLAQASFNSYKSKKEQEILELNNNLKKLSSLQGAASGLDGDLQKAALEQIDALEKVMVAQGYELEEVRAEAAKLVSDPNALKRLDEAKKEPEKTGKENTMSLSEKDIAELLRTTGNNIAAGGIHMSAKIAYAMDRARQLGIPLTSEQIEKLPEAIIKGFEQNKTPEQSMDEVLGFSVKQTEIDKTKREAELAAAKEAGRQEALKETGVTIRKQGNNQNPHPVLSKLNHAIGDRKPVQQKKFSEVTQDDIDKLPENQAGDKELFRLRANDEFERREKHTRNAVDRFEKESQNYDEDGRFIGHMQQQEA